MRLPGLALAAVAAAAAATACCAHALHRYGHAYQAPGDFTAEQYSEIAATFPVFTVEKRHAFAVYGDSSAPSSSPAHYNSINATIGTARKIKALNSSVRVLMYWNSEVNYGFYECEAQVQKAWLLNGGGGKLGHGSYNYSVPAFRQWWTSCAVGAFRQAGGLIDGFFLDAAPKVATHFPNGAALWGAMVDELRAAVGPDAFFIYNGYYAVGDGGGAQVAGAPWLAHTDAVYVESLASLGGAQPRIAPAHAASFLRWVASASAGGKLVFGHGLAPPSNSSGGDTDFVFGLAVYLLVADDPDASGWFLGNAGYNVDQGLLTPHARYAVSVGRPLAPFSQAGQVLSRGFEGANVTVDLASRTATIEQG